MDGEDSVNTFILLYERLLTDDTALEEAITATIPATDREGDWKVVLNPDLLEEKEVDVIPGKDANPVKPRQALVFLDDRHAGIIGTGPESSMETGLIPRVRASRTSF